MLKKQVMGWAIVITKHAGANRIMDNRWYESRASARQALKSYGIFQKSLGVVPIIISYKPPVKGK